MDVNTRLKDTFVSAQGLSHANYLSGFTPRELAVMNCVLREYVIFFLLCFCIIFAFVCMCLHVCACVVVLVKWLGVCMLVLHTHLCTHANNYTSCLGVLTALYNVFICYFGMTQVVFSYNY